MVRALGAIWYLLKRSALSGAHAVDPVDDVVDGDALFAGKSGIEARRNR